MGTPLPELLDAYGTRDYYLRKQAGIFGDLSETLSNRIAYGPAGTPILSKALSVAGELAPPMAFLGLMRHSSREDAQLLANAQAMNEQMQMAEHARMSGTISAFGGGSQSYPGMTWETETKVGNALKPEVEKVAVELGRAMAHEYVKLAGLKEAGIFSTMAGWAAKKFPSLAGKAATAVKAPAAAAPAAGIGERAVGALRKFWQGGAERMASQGSKPFRLMSPMTKLKVLGGGTLALGGLGLYEAGKGAKQYMMTPTAQEHWGGHGPSPRANLTPYGY